MILRRYELQKLIEIHYGIKCKIDSNELSAKIAGEGWEQRDTAAALNMPITLKIPSYYFEKLEHRRSLGILFICNGLSGVAIKSLLEVDAGTVSRWKKPAYEAAFLLARKLIAGIQKAKNFSDEDIQADLGIDKTILEEFKKEDEYKYAYNAWIIDPNVAVAPVHFQEPQNPRRRKKGSNL